MDAEGGWVGEVNFGDRTTLALGSQVLISQLSYSFVCL